MNYEYTPKFLARFWAKVDCTAGLFECWLWMAAGANHRGYGLIRLDRHGAQVHAHRVSYQIAYGPFPDDLDVLHKCDTPRCVNPLHLFLGTQQDNSLDMISKGRHAHLSGEQLPQCKLSDAQVAEIRQRYATGEITQQSLADEFGVTDGNISAIVNYRTRR